MRFFADEQDGNAGVARGPDGVVQNQPGERGDNDIDDLGRDASEIDDGNRLALIGNPQEVAEQFVE